jgi:hypothetical protein
VSAKQNRINQNLLNGENLVKKKILRKMSNLITQQKQPQPLQLKEISIIPITVPVGGQNTTGPGQTQIASAPSSITITGNTQAADDSRKKRCTDRYDSSESSDR